MTESNPIKLLRQLKGAPLSVLLALVFAGQRVSSGWIETVTGYTDKPVASALDLLREYGWAAKVQGGWIVSNVEQLPLILESRNNSALSSSSNESINLINTIDSTTTNISRKNSEFSANLLVLLSGGIKDPKASDLADLEHATPEYITAHLRQVKDENRNVATAIYRIENAWDKPEAPADITPAASNPYSGSEFYGEVYQ